MIKIRTSLLFALFFCVILEGQAQEYGICLRSTVAVRGEKSDTSEQVTQLMFGDAFRILDISEDQKWFRIENHYDQYQGWIRKAQFYPIPEDYYQAYVQTAHPVIIRRGAQVMMKEEKIAIPVGSSLPFYENGNIRIDEQRYAVTGLARDITQKVSKDTLVLTAQQFLGTPYLWGGKSPKGWDCSGFTQVLYKMHGYTLPRDSYQQAEQGQTISIEEAKAGDLAFFQRKPEGDGRVVHVGILLGNGKIIHADGKVRINRIDETGLYRDDLGKYSHYLKLVKRLPED